MRVAVLRMVAIAAFVGAHPQSIVSTLLLTVNFDASVDPPEPIP